MRLAEMYYTEIEVEWMKELLKEKEEYIQKLEKENRELRKENESLKSENKRFSDLRDNLE